MLAKGDKKMRATLEACRENNISEQTFHRWKREFGMIDVNQAKRMKELVEGVLRSCSFCLSLSESFLGCPD